MIVLKKFFLNDSNNTVISLYLDKYYIVIDHVDIITVIDYLKLPISPILDIVSCCARYHFKA